MPYLDPWMLVDPRDLEGSPDGRMGIEQDDGPIIPARVRKRQDHMQPRAVQEGEPGEIEVQLTLRRRVVEKRLRELGRSSEIELSCQAQALVIDEWRHLEHRHGVPPFEKLGKLKHDPKRT